MPFLLPISDFIYRTSSAMLLFFSESRPHSATGCNYSVCSTFRTRTPENMAEMALHSLYTSRLVSDFKHTAMCSLAELDVSEYPNGESFSSQEGVHERFFIKRCMT